MEKCLSKRRLEEHQSEYSIITTSNVSDLNCQKISVMHLISLQDISFFTSLFFCQPGKDLLGTERRYYSKSRFYFVECCLLFFVCLFFCFFVFFVSSNFIAISVVFVARVNLDNYNNHLLYTVI